MTAYVDSSAIVKLVVREPESKALVAELADHDTLLTSEIAIVEVGRAAWRAGGAPDAPVEVLDRFALVAVDAEVVRVARTVEPAQLRTLDAIHLASALTLGIDDLTLVAYDERLLAAAGAAGLRTAAPGV